MLTSHMKVRMVKQEKMFRFARRLPKQLTDIHLFERLMLTSYYQLY